MIDGRIRRVRARRGSGRTSVLPATASSTTLVRVPDHGFIRRWRAKTSQLNVLAGRVQSYPIRLSGKPVILAQSSDSIPGFRAGRDWSVKAPNFVSLVTTDDHVHRLITSDLCIKIEVRSFTPASATRSGLPRPQSGFGCSAVQDFVITPGRRFPSNKGWIQVPNTKGSGELIRHMILPPAPAIAIERPEPVTEVRVVPTGYNCRVM